MIRYYRYNYSAVVAILKVCLHIIIIIKHAREHSHGAFFCILTTLMLILYMYFLHSCYYEIWMQDLNLYWGRLFLWVHCCFIEGKDINIFLPPLQVIHVFQGWKEASWLNWAKVVFVTSCGTQFQAVLDITS